MEEKIPLTEAEWRIMRLLWAEGPQTIMQLTRGLAQETGWTKHTVIALLRRMEQKGTASLETQGRAKLVRPLVSREQVARQQTETLLDRLYDGRPSLLLAEMVSREDITPEEIEAMRAIIEEAKAREEGS